MGLKDRQRPSSSNSILQAKFEFCNSQNRSGDAPNFHIMWVPLNHAATHDPFAQSQPGGIVAAALQFVWFTHSREQAERGHGDNHDRIVSSRKNCGWVFFPRYFSSYRGSDSAFFQVLAAKLNPIFIQYIIIKLGQWQLIAACQGGNQSLWLAGSACCPLRPTWKR
jgi:hypothetical protein